MYLDGKTAEMQKRSRLAKLGMMLVHCCLRCLEKCARYITESAYILIAVEGSEANSGHRPRWLA